MNVSSWRQMTIAIDREYLQGRGQRLDPNPDGDMEEDDEGRSSGQQRQTSRVTGAEAIHHLQASHSARVGNLHYAKPSGSERGTDRSRTATLSWAQSRLVAIEWSVATSARDGRGVITNDGISHSTPRQPREYFNCLIFPRQPFTKTCCIQVARDIITATPFTYRFPCRPSLL